MRWRDVNLNPDERLLRQFGALLALFCAALASWQAMALQRTVGAWLFGTLAVVSATLALLRPAWQRPLFVVSVVATFPIGWGVSNLMLALLFYGVITPLALVFRWRGRDHLQRRPPSASESTFWVPKEASRGKEDYFRQF